MLMYSFSKLKKNVCESKKIQNYTIKYHKSINNQNWSIVDSLLRFKLSTSCHRIYELVFGEIQRHYFFNLRGFARITLKPWKVHVFLFGFSKKSKFIASKQGKIHFIIDYFSCCYFQFILQVSFFSFVGESGAKKKKVILISFPKEIIKLTDIGDVEPLCWSATYTMALWPSLVHGGWSGKNIIYSSMALHSQRMFFMLERCDGGSL